MSHELISDHTTLLPESEDGMRYFEKLEVGVLQSVTTSEKQTDFLNKE